jgi:replicative DNA helicase
VKKIIQETPAIPYSERSERAVLGTLLRQNESWKDAECLTESDFYITSHQRIFACMRSRLAIGRPIDFILAWNALEKQKELDTIGGLEYLAGLTDLIPRNFNISAHVRELKDKARLRALLAIFDNATRQIYAEVHADEVVATVQERIAAASIAGLTCTK